MKKQKITKWHYIAWVFLLGLIYFIFSNNPKNETNKKEDLSTQAFVICKDLVRKKLLFPATADFPFLDRKVWNRGEQSYKIRSYVDSQNEYGATIRTDWNCYMKYRGTGEVYDPINWKHELEFI